MRIRVAWRLVSLSLSSEHVVSWPFCHGGESSWRQKDLPIVPTLGSLIHRVHVRGGLRREEVKWRISARFVVGLGFCVFRHAFFGKEPLEPSEAPSEIGEIQGPFVRKAGSLRHLACGGGLQLYRD
ncbi:uncharacterized protein F5Z01DRAFT_170628 [Emericellopsis atlantica]|uniref:Secreted protein n=1 Tax=Emericellopsis atlantica TaxID=2614577 RepID=A0A9P7ZJY3_9HYPO|nr:uncharacterized protein F5Z01DRAFT_170628 [Emericellopsis atlantica]KAG9252995.1 hypothetical protein F5Z01DRAFT_170628 [Emericellopsis atlantica]